MLVSSKAWLCPCFPLNSISILWKGGGWILRCVHSCSTLLPRRALTPGDFHPISSFNSSFSPIIHFSVIHSQGTAILLLPKPSRFQLYIARSVGTEMTWGWDSSLRRSWRISKYSVWMSCGKRRGVRAKAGINSDFAVQCGAPRSPLDKSYREKPLWPTFSVAAVENNMIQSRAATVPQRRKEPAHGPLWFLF